MRPAFTAPVLIALLLVTACTGAVESPPSSAVASANPASEPPSRAGSETAPPNQPRPGTGELLFGGVGLEVSLSTPTSGGGSRPLLQWEAVAGADHYGAYVYAPDGSIYWAWTGRTTSVHVGGEPQLRDGASGPSIVEGMSWAVIAYDAELLPVAVSELRPIAP